MEKTDIITQFAFEYGLNDLLLQTACNLDTSHEVLVRELVNTADLETARKIIKTPFNKILKIQLKYEIEKFILEHSKSTDDFTTIVSRVKHETAQLIENLSIASDIPKSKIIELAVTKYAETVTDYTDCNSSLS